MFIENPKEFTVKRGDWSRGEGPNSRLLDDFGRYDCIGFLLKYAGVDNSILLNKSEPIDIILDNEWNSPLIKICGRGYTQSAICSEIIEVNDRTHCADREEKLIALFNSIDIKLEFED